jgi:chromosome segregation ATPase
MTDQVTPSDGGNSKFQLAQELGNFLKPFGDIVALRDKLLQVSGLENAAASAKATVAAAKDDFAKLKAERSQARADIETAKAEADRVRSAAQLDADGVRAKAKSDGEALVAKAQALADEHEERARQAQHAAAAAVGAHRDAMASVQAAKAEQARIEQEIANLKARVFG